MNRNIDFGLYIKGLRGKKTLRQVETETGITSSHLSKIERGERGFPKPGILKKASLCL